VSQINGIPGQRIADEANDLAVYYRLDGISAKDEDLRRWRGTGKK
jgi:hypothetical protein